MIEFESVTKRFGDAAPAVDDLSLEILDGELTVLVGPSGCGKTTSLRMINRLDEPSAGCIRVDGQDIMTMDRIELRRGIGYVMQTSGLFPHRRVRENIATVPHLLGWDRARIERRVQELVDVVGLLPEILDRYPHALSGGQRQRVGVARALAADPPIMLMDEPFAAVDPIVRTRLQDELVRLQRRLGKTIVFVTHDIDEAIRIGDRIAVLREPGQVAQYASPAEILTEPADPFVRDFLGHERELRRLALVKVREVTRETAPLAMIGDSVESARESAQQHERDWILILDADQQLAGWAPVSRLVGSGVFADLAHPFKYTVTPEDTLRSALNAMIVSDIGVAPCIDDQGRFQGLITQASVRSTLS